MTSLQYYTKVEELLLNENNAYSRFLPADHNRDYVFERDTRRQGSSDLLPNCELFLYSKVFNVHPICNLDHSLSNINNYTVTNFLYHNYHTCHCLFTIEKDIVLAQLTVDNRFQVNKYVVTQLLDSISKTITMPTPDTYDYNPEILDKFVSIFRPVYDYILKMQSVYINIETQNNIEEIQTIILSKILYSLKNDPKFYENSSKLIKTIKSSLSEIISDGNNQNYSFSDNLLCNQNILYRNLVSKTIVNLEKCRKSNFHKGLLYGQTVVNTLLQLGYTTSTDNLWVKNIMIIPQYCIHKEMVYRFKKEDQNQFFVENLQFEISGTKKIDSCFTCESAKHPNISRNGNSVCIGRENVHLAISNVEDLNSFKTLLEEVEKSLYVINFDSAYQSFSIYYPNLKIEDILVQNDINNLESIRQKTADTKIELRRV